MSLITVSAQQQIIRGTVKLPASKSISNRLLIIDFLSKQPLQINNISEADDTQLMQQLLSEIKNNQHQNGERLLNCKNSGTVFRFLTALLSITKGKWILTGSERMKHRPVEILVESLQQIGAQIEYLENEGYPPLKVSGRELAGGEIEIDGSVSSQYISALMMIAPALNKGLSITITGKTASRPYISMTSDLMKKSGIDIVSDNNHIRIPPQLYSGRQFTVEGDWSSAAFWYEVAALCPNAEIILETLTKKSAQGDSILPGIFEHFGVRTSYSQNNIKISGGESSENRFVFDFTNHPDLALPVIVTSAARNIPGRFSGLESLKIKESDRVKALMTALEKLGFETALSDQNVLTTIPHSYEIKDIIWENPVNVWSDHRMAMAFAPLALLRGSIKIMEPEVVAKSYPGFWNDLSKCGFQCKF